MAKIGTMELLVILLVALFAIGPERLPKAARALGKAVRDCRRYMDEASLELKETQRDIHQVQEEIQNSAGASDSQAAHKEETSNG